MNKENMRIAFPVMEDRGLDSEISAHFGKSSYFLIVDLSTEKIQRLDTNKSREEGECSPIQALKNLNCDAVMVRRLGTGAYQRCTDAGMNVLEAVGRNIAECLQSFRARQVYSFPISLACSGHSHSEKKSKCCSSGAH